MKSMHLSRLEKRPLGLFVFLENLMLSAITGHADKIAKSFLSDTSFCIIDNKKIIRTERRGILWRLPIIISRNPRTKGGIYQDDLAAAIGSLFALSAG